MEFNINIWDEVVKWLHEQGKFTPEMLTEEPARNLIGETNRILSDAVHLSITEEVPPELTAQLEQNAYVFSAFKGYHSLKEASLKLTNDKGGIKPFETFKQDVLKVHKSYNVNYLEAEYNFAVQSAQMAVKWADYVADGDRYYLQYRTADDSKVRAEHAALHGTTLPVDDPFWDNYFPPLGWNCRCTAVQVRKDKYPVSDSTTAIQAGERATESKKQQIFRFNPGKEGKVFPPKHPYLPKGCEGCKKNNSINLVFDNPKTKCKVCSKSNSNLIKWSRNSVREHFKKIFKGKTEEWEVNDGVIGKLSVSYQDIKTLTGKPHEYPYARNMSVFYLKKLLKQAKYVGSSPDIKTGNTKSHNNVVMWHYYEIPFMGQKSYLEIKEYNDGVMSPHHIQDEKHFDVNKIKNKDR